MTQEYLVIVALVAIVVLLVYLFVGKLRQYQAIHLRYKDIMSLDKAVDARNSDIAGLDAKFAHQEKQHKERTSSLNEDYQRIKAIFDGLDREVKLLEEDLDFADYGLYKPHYDFDTSEEYKRQLEEVRSQQKDMVRQKEAVVCDVDWTVGGSRTEGRKMTNQYMRLMLRAFNNECDAAILKVRWNNADKMEQRIERAYEAINKMGTVHNTK